MQHYCIQLIEHGWSRRYTDLGNLQDTPILDPRTSAARAGRGDGVGEDTVDSSTESWQFNKFLLIIVF